MLDVARLVIFRIKHHKNPFKPDMNHIHHKLIQLGCTPRKALLILLGADAVLILLNAFFSMYVNVNILLAVDIIIYYCLIRFLTERILKKGLGQHPVQVQ